MHDKHLTELAERRTLNLDSEAATQSLGAALSAQLTPGMVIWLEGDLGAGKTTLVRAMLKSAGETGSVKSPTYTLVEVHPISGLNFYHFDFYRFNQPEEYLDAGLDDYFSAGGICLVEWPGQAAPYVPAADIRIELQLAPQGRIAVIVAASERGRACLAGVRSSSTPPPA